MRAFDIRFFVGAVLACNDPEPARDRDPSEAVIRAPLVTIESLVENPQHYENQTTRVEGVVSRVLTPRAFLLRDDAPFSSHSILILTREPAELAGLPLRPGDRSIVRGMVRRSDVTALERELGWNLERQVESAKGGKPAIIARDVGRSSNGRIEWLTEEP